MKKLFLIAVAGMMMFAFTQCGGGSKSSKNSDNTETTENRDDDEYIDEEEGSDAFREAKNIINNAIKGVRRASDCESLEKVEEDYRDAIDAYVSKYGHDSDFTDEEEEELEELSFEFDSSYEEKEKELCNDPFSAAIRIFDKAIADMEFAYSCEELEEIKERMEDAIDEYISKYGQDNDFTEEEEDELEELSERYYTLSIDKRDELCYGAGDSIDYSDAFNEAKNVILTTIDRMNYVYDCDDLESVADDFERQMNDLEEKYPDYKPSGAEEEEVQSLVNNLFEVVMQKSKELDCE